MNNIAQLPGTVRLNDTAPNENVIRLCKEALARAESGEFQGIAIIAVCADSTTERIRHFRCYSELSKAIGATFAEATSMAESLNDNAKVQEAER